MIKLWDFVKGIILRVSTYGTEHQKEGAIWVQDDSGNKIKTYLGGAPHQVVTNDQTQILTNKTIDADLNPISNIENADIKAGAAIDAAKIANGSVSNTEFQYLNGVSSSVVGVSDTQTLSNKSLVDLFTAIVDVGDPTIQMTFDPSGTSGTTTVIASSQTATRVVTLPDASTTLVGTNATQTLSNKNIIDNNSYFVDVGDNTKRIKLDAAGTTGTTTTIISSQTSNKNITLPDATTTLVGTDTIDALTNKTIDSDLNTIINIVNADIKASAGILESKLTLDYSTSSLNSSITNHISDTSTHGTTGDILGTTDTQNVSNKTITASSFSGGTVNNTDVNLGTASNTQKLVVSKDTSANLAALTREEASIYYDTTLDKPVYDDGSNLIPIGSGGGDFNFLSNKTLTDYVTYDDGATSIPIDGNGGSPSAISVASSPSPITNESGKINFRISKSAASGQGEGVAISFATRGDIDSGAIRTAKLYIKSSANYSDNDFGVYLYDVTNSQLIFPADQNVKASSFVSRQQFSFQFPSNSTSLRIILHCQSVNATAYDLDATLEIVEQKTGTGAVQVYLGNQTVTVSDATGVSSRTAECWREGEFLVIQPKIVWNGAGAGSSFAITLPFGLSSSSKSPDFKGDPCFWNDSGAKYRNLLAYMATPTTIGFLEAETTNRWDGSQAANGDYIGGTLRVNIDGWSSSQVLSEDVSSRNIVARITLNSAANHTSLGNLQKVPLNNAQIDKVGGFDLANNRYVFQESGSFILLFSSAFSGLADTKTAYAVARINGTTKAWGSLSTQGAGDASISAGGTILDVTKGQYVELFAYQNDSASEAYFITDDAVCLSIAKIQNSQQIAASEVQSGSYLTTDGTSIATGGSGTTYKYVTKVSDSHSAYNTSTGELEAKRSGNLELLASTYLDSAGTPWSGIEIFELQVLLEGNVIARSYNQPGSTVSDSPSTEVNVKSYPIVKGQKITTRVFQNSGGSIPVGTATNGYSRLEWRIS